LETLGERVPQAKAGELAKRLVVAMATEQNSARLSSLANGLRALGEPVPQAKAEELAKWPVVAMATEQNSAHRSLLTEVFRTLPGERMPQAMARELAERLVVAMATEQNSTRLSSLANGLRVLGENLEPTTTKWLLRKMMSITTTANMASPLCVSASSLVRKAHLGIILDILKWPTCSSHARLRIIAAIEKMALQEKMIEESFRSAETHRGLAMLVAPEKNIDFWKFLDFAETWALKNHYNIEAPPYPPSPSLQGGTR